MRHVTDKLKLLVRDPQLKRKTYFTLFIFLVFRIFAFLPMPAIDFIRLKALFSQNQFLSLLDIFSGGTLVNFSVMALGLNPYINASIIFQLLTVVVPRFEQLAREGEYGRFKINQYTRALTVPLTIIQAVGIYFLLKNQKIITTLNPVEFFSFIFTLVAGTFILVWFGELLTEYGLGNGISLLIFAGIVGRAPVFLGQFASTLTSENVLNTVIFLGLGALVIMGVVFINEAVRKIPVYYAKRVKGNKMYQGASNFLPLKLNQAGVIPIIFAVSFVLLPQLLGNFLGQVNNKAIASAALGLARLFDPKGGLYNSVYFLLVVGFTYFYTLVVFNPQKIADEIQKAGGFIPGIRPGSATSNYLAGVIYKITSVGALFLGIIAVLPAILSAITGITGLVIGGTGVLIVVSVILETFKAVEAQMVMKNYDRFQTRSM